jgi:hypothetical protein
MSRLISDRTDVRRRRFARSRRTGETRTAAQLLCTAAIAVFTGLLASGCGSAATAVSGGVGSAAGDSSEVLPVPELNAGWAGWCFIAPGVGAACAGAEHHTAVLEEAWVGSTDPPEAVGVAVTTEEVLRLEVVDGSSASTLVGDGVSVPTRPVPRVTAGVRAAAIRVKWPSTDGLPHFIPRNGEGKAIPQSNAEAADRVLAWSPTVKVSNPAKPSQGICKIDMRASARDLSADGGSVIASLHRYSGVVGSGFITCASTSYDLAGWPLLASVLVSASHPGARPSSLSAMKPVLGHPGVFSAPGPELDEGELYARRVRGGWLVVSRAKASQRLALLGDLDASVGV